MANKTLHNKKALLEALEQSRGVVTSACKKVGISRVTYYVYYKEDEEFRNSVNELHNVALDFAESQLHRQIKDGIPSSTIFYLKTKGKRRGYIERTEQEVSFIEQKPFKSLSLDVPEDDSTKQDSKS